MELARKYSTEQSLLNEKDVIQQFDEEIIAQYVDKDFEEQKQEIMLKRSETKVDFNELTKRRTIMMSRQKSSLGRINSLSARSFNSQERYAESQRVVTEKEESLNSSKPQL